MLNNFRPPTNVLYGLKKQAGNKLGYSQAKRSSFLMRLFKGLNPFIPTNWLTNQFKTHILYKK